MAYFQRQRVLSPILRGVDFHFFQKYIKFAKLPFCKSSQNIAGDANPRFYNKSNAARSKNCVYSAEKCCMVEKKIWIETEEALFDYLYVTRSFPFIHAEYMSSNSPFFLQKLLKEVQNGVVNDETGNSVTRYLRYHPINEFEPFFESIGLKPYEFVPILPRNLIYLADDSLLLQNYNVLCNYGIPRNKIGHIYMEATEVFGYDGDILKSKLQSFEDTGLHRSSICKFVTSTPIILIHDGIFIMFVKKMNMLGIKYSFIEAQMKKGKSYNLSHIVGVLCFIFKLYCNQNHVRELFMQHPEFLFEESGNKTFSLIGFLLKYGLTMQRILSLFLQFPDIQVGKFMQNMHKCYDFLKFISMDDDDIEKIVQSHTAMLGSCSLKQPLNICNSLCIRRSKIREIVREDPEVMMKWVLRTQIEHFGPTKNRRLPIVPATQRATFFLELGFIKDSTEMARAMKYCRTCTVSELNKRFDVFLKAGWDQKTVVDMLKKCPRLLDQKREAMERKIDILVGDFGIPMSSISMFPECLIYGIQRLQLRFTMYGWLKNQGVCRWDLKISYILNTPEKLFLKRFVYSVARGLDVWKEFKKEFKE